MLRKRTFWLAILPVVLVVGFSTLLLLTNHLIPFANDFHCDPWHFFGFFYLADRPELLDPYSRRLWRIPAFLIGYYLTRVLPGVGADYANFLVLYAGSVLATYFSARRLFGTFTASIAATFLALNAVFVGSMSVTYTGPAVLFNTIAIWLAICALDAARLNRNILLAACGVALGFAIHAHLAVIECSACVPLYSLPWRNIMSREWLRRTVETGIAVASGIVLATLLIGVINWGLFNGRFWFFVDIPTFLSRADTIDYYIKDWFFLACRGALVVLAAAIPLFQVGKVLWTKSFDLVDTRILSANVPLGILIVLLVVRSWFGDLFLQFDYYYVTIVPFIAISIASVFSRLNASSRVKALLLATYAVLAALSILPTIDDMARVSLSPDRAWFSLTMAGLVTAAVCAFGFSQGRRQAITAAAVLLVALAGFGFSVRPQRMGRLVWQNSYRDLPDYGAPSYARVRSAVSFLASHTFASRPVFWVSAEHGLEETIGVARSFDYCGVEMNLPEIDKSEGIFEREFKAGRPIVLVDKDPALVELANTSLQPYRLSVEPSDRTTISYDGVDFSVVIGTLKAN